ncbi:unnamed protein product [Linum tenue]|uniref:Secreted protein n=1 Tax=Linum tenue TaxID=586396 RepID=A0AAV0KG80_9ROSI|nr:unnamed protein product [Linum tenue]
MCALLPLLISLPPSPFQLNWCTRAIPGGDNGVNLAMRLLQRMGSILFFVVADYYRRRSRVSKRVIPKLDEAATESGRKVERFSH